jgi:chromosome partitioning protein
MVITLLAKKGGVGKSTVSLLLHEGLRQAGKSVAIRDWDQQGTSNKALELIDGQKAQDAKGYDVLIYDTPPNLGHTATSLAVQNADIVLIVATPSPFDIWEAEEAATFVRGRRPDVPVFVLFNKVKRNTLLGRVLDDNAKQLSAPVLPNMLSARECYQHAGIRGWKALDGAAREEVFRLTLAVTTSPIPGIPVPPAADAETEELQGETAPQES